MYMQENALDSDNHCGYIVQDTPPPPIIWYFVAFLPNPPTLKLIFSNALLLSVCKYNISALNSSVK